ncbi:FAD-dependent monooxygenase [Alcaligenaceae bacterium CGII-47]|nr:FAD-dependent monooxygenase [Alcaligenaceae bacterium CGII-47]
MTRPEFDIAIIGTGPVGCTLALCLARQAPEPSRIVLLGPDAVPSPDKQQIDPRTLALNHGSRSLLESLGAWPQQCADILSVHVSQAQHLGRTLIDQVELGVPRLGSVVAYDAVLTALHQALAHSGIHRILARPQRPIAGPSVRIQTPDQTLDAHIALVSNGERPQGLHREYGQHAVLASVQATQPITGRAFERFTRHGPLALLPHPQGKALYSLVWCVPPARAQMLHTMDAPAFDNALQQAFGQRLGALHGIGERHVFPLVMHAGASLLDPHIVALGNAAQTLHPVAGQGLNLGLRDAAQLAQTLAPWLHQPQRDAAPELARFAQQRRADRSLTLAITDTLPRLFATANPLVRHACGTALMALDLLPGLRKPLARHLLQGLRS